MRNNRIGKLAKTISSESLIANVSVADTYADTITYDDVGKLPDRISIDQVKKVAIT